MHTSHHVILGIVFGNFSCVETNENIDKNLDRSCNSRCQHEICCQFLLSLISELALSVGHNQHLRAKQEKEICFGGTILFNASMGVRGQR